MKRVATFLAIIAMVACSFAAPTPAPAALERGALVRVVRDQMMLFYGKPWRMAKKGEVFEVLDVRPATGQVFVATKDKERVIAVALPLQNVIPEKTAKRIERVEQSAALFAGLIPRLNLRIAPEAVERLRKEPKKYVEAVIEEEGAKNYEKIAIKLKGSAGSFRGIDDRPGFSINCTKYDGADRFHGLKRFQLNNCAQDGTALNELVTGEMARAAKVPASRCTHAIVSLNGRDLGIYVLKEGFTEEFLAAFFKNTDGHLYDGGFCAEINENMELDRGDENNKDRLRELVGAINEPDPAKQFARLSAVVDVDAYLRYLAMENILVHWDGYSFNRNNYRIYENPETGKFHFILHGMDQMFGDANASIQREPGGQVGAILWRRAEVRERYFAQLTDIWNKVIKPVNWPARVEGHGRRLLAAVANAKPDLAKSYEPQIDGARNRVGERLKQVQRMIEAPRFVNTLAAKGTVELDGAEWTAQAQNAEANEVTDKARRCLRLRATGEASASWRTSIAVPPGRIRFEAKMKTIGVDPLTSESGEGAGLRISGGSRKGQKSLSGDATWQTMIYEWESPGADTVLVLELNAKAGELLIDRQTLRVTRLTNLPR